MVVPNGGGRGRGPRLSHFLILRLQLDNGSRVDIDYSSYGQPSVITELTTGQRLNVTGRLSGRRKIVALAIAAEPRPKVEPIVRKRVAAAATVTLPGGVIATSGGLPLTSNPVTTSEMKILVIPIWAADSNGDACPGTTLPTYTPEEVSSIVGNASPSVVSQIRDCSRGMTTAEVSYTDWARIDCSGYE